MIVAICKNKVCQDQREDPKLGQWKADLPSNQKFKGGLVLLPTTGSTDGVRADDSSTCFAPLCCKASTLPETNMEVDNHLFVEESSRRPFSTAMIAGALVVFLPGLELLGLFHEGAEITSLSASESGFGLKSFINQAGQTPTTRCNIDIVFKYEHPSASVNKDKLYLKHVKTASWTKMQFRFHTLIHLSKWYDTCCCFALR